MVDTSKDRAVARKLDRYSLELTAKDKDALEKAAEVIPQNTLMSLTDLKGDRPEARVDVIRRVKQLGFEPSVHISARRVSSETGFVEFLGRLEREVGVRHAFVIAGDPRVAEGPYEDALAVINSGQLARHGFETVGIAGYPEGHPDIGDDKLWDALRRKHAALKADGNKVEIVTQFGFDAEPVLQWLEEVRALGIDAPVRIGVPGPATVSMLLRFAARCGVGASAKIMTKYGVSITQLIKTAGPNRLLSDFADRLEPARHGPTSIHFYPFGGLVRTAEYANDLVNGAGEDIDAGAARRASDRG